MLEPRKIQSFSSEILGTLLIKLLFFSDNEAMVDAATQAVELSLMLVGSDKIILLEGWAEKHT